MPLQAILEAGSMTGWGPKGEILINAVRHEIKTPLNPTTGKRDSIRSHGPFVVVKRIDQSTPFFHEHQTLGAVITPCKLRLIHNPRQGPAANYVTVTLTGAKVVGIKTVMPRNSDPALSMVHEYEEISLGYSQIEWKEEQVAGAQNGGATGADKGEGGGLLFLPDWLNEKARAEAVKQYADFKKRGVEYGTKMYDDLVAKVKEEIQAIKNATAPAGSAPGGTPAPPKPPK